ncbi:hypothetical protein R3W88_006990 [Solanum pinnatisectum]|uniref:E2 ubiquitin-conjugating enzyme n=1 Tax=Solanum pinnatisectum TaxID=50273 RepID=A0AAV9KGI4_9SOLN|nr:hypothetical protein R3W88_006990 [Solanum pinnatisectum]
MRAVWFLRRGRRDTENETPTVVWFCEGDDEVEGRWCTRIVLLGELGLASVLLVDGNKNLHSEPITFIEILAAFNTQAVRMSTPARKRLMRDFKRLQQDPPAGISGAPYDNNIMLWNAVIFGPDDTPWDGGTFKLTLQFSEDYPNKPPTVRFVSRMFHPNIYADGSICLNILQNQWSPIYDVAAILTSIQSLLCDPNPNSPANSEAARMFSENKREYNRKVREIVEQSWTAD